MKIGLIDVDGILPNLALMKLSSFHKAQGDIVELYQTNTQYDHIYASAIFYRSRERCLDLLNKHGDRITIGGTGFAPKKALPPEIHACRPDYDLYTADMIAPHINGIMTAKTRRKKAEIIVNAGMGFTSRGCIRNCGFCGVPEAEGPFRQDSSIRDIINPRSNVIILHDNNITADPLCLDKLHEIRDRGLIVDINQGIDVRLMNPDIAQALREVHHLRNVHYAWDLMAFEHKVLDGIKLLTERIPTWKQLCFMLTGYDTRFDEDMYRFRRLSEMGVSPYVMIYNNVPDVRLHHFARWVNGRFCKACSFDDYEPWARKREIPGQVSMEGVG